MSHQKRGRGISRECNKASKPATRGFRVMVEKEKIETRNQQT